MIAHKIAESSIATVATPDYLRKHGVPKHPSELDRHETLIFMQQGAAREWVFEYGSERIVLQPKGRFRTNDSELLRIAVLSHLGIANGPAWLFAKEFASGTLIHLFKEYAAAKPIYALRPGGRRLAAKVRVFIDFMEEILKRELSATVSETIRSPLEGLAMNSA